MKKKIVVFISFYTLLLIIATYCQYKNKFVINFVLPLFYIFGAFFFAFGLLLLILGTKNNKYKSDLTFQNKDIFKIVRYPIYAGFFFISLGSMFLLRIWLLFLTLLPILHLFLRIYIKKEDNRLIKKFEEKYISYKNRVNAIFPTIKNITAIYMYPLETSKISDNLFAVKNRGVNIYILKTKNNYICFDTGYGDREILDELKKLNIDPDKITTIFLTHTDPDHAQGLKFFKNAQLFFGKDELPLINGTKKRLFPGIYNHKIERKYQLLENNQTICIENCKIKTIHTPGHTPGHTSYIINDKFVIAGDVVVVKNNKIKPFYRFLNIKQKQIQKSTQEIKKLAKKYTICTAHTGIIYPTEINKQHENIK